MSRPSLRVFYGYLWEILLYTTLDNNVSMSFLIILMRYEEGMGRFTLRFYGLPIFPKYYQRLIDKNCSFTKQTPF